MQQFYQTFFRFSRYSAVARLLCVPTNKNSRV